MVQGDFRLPAKYTSAPSAIERIHDTTVHDTTVPKPHALIQKDIDQPQVSRDHLQVCMHAEAHFNNRSIVSEQTT